MGIPESIVLFVFILLAFIAALIGLL